jgi:hypothetical protein
MGRVLAAPAAAGLLLLAAPPAAAQSLDAALAGWDAHRLIYSRRGAYAQHGVALAASGTVRLGRASLTAGVARGTLGARSGLPNVDVRLRSETVGLLVRVVGDLAVGASREVRRFHADAGVTTWVLQGVETRFEPELGLAGLRGIAGVSLLGSSRVHDGPGFARAVRTAMGVSLRPGRLPVGVHVTYRFERFDLERGVTDLADVRYEEFSGIVVELVARLRR